MVALISHSALGPWTSERLSDCTLYVAPRAGLSDPPSCPWIRVAGVEDGVTAFAADQDTLYLVSYRDTPRSQVLAVSFADPDLSRARSVVPLGARAVEAVQVAGDYLLVRDLDGGIGRLRRVPLAGGEPEDIPLPVEGGILEWAGHPDRPGSCCWFRPGPMRRRSTATTGTLERWPTSVWGHARRSTSVRWTPACSRCRPGTAR
jgi:prolyl oligopeptidase